MKLHSRFALCLLLLTGLAKAQSVVVTNSPAWDTSTASALAIAFGAASNGTFGQTFKAPTANLQLDSFTFWLKDSVGSRAINFSGYLMEWDGNSATGPVLWQSASSYTVPNSSAFRPYTFAIGGLLLDPAKTYVAFAEAPTAYSLLNLGGSLFGYTNSNSYSDGQFVYSLNGGNLNGITNNWTSANLALIGGGPGSKDLAFRASFTAVPEPSTYALLGAGSLMALAALRRRRKS